MKHLSLRNRKWNFSALAFWLPFLGITMVMLVSGYTPFGQASMLYSDMYHQYFPFFVAFRKALRSGESLLYTWQMGLGMDYVGLISYYLASPLNLLSVLVPEGILLQYFSFLVPLKLGLAGLFFSIFLKKAFHKDDISITLFGCFYALCAWALGYQWNVMWLDTFALLPLVVLGMINLLEKRKVILYVGTLFLSVAANYYVGLFTCIFVLLCFICYEICRWKSFKKFIFDLLLMGLFSLLAIGLTAFLELPTLAALQTTQSSVNKFPKGFKLNIASSNTWKGLLIAMMQVAGNGNGGLEPTFKEGLPNLYCGVITTIFATIFFTSRQIKLREKICAGLLLLFFNLSFIIRQLDYIWHGFHFTNMIPYRFSFLYSFVMLYMAYRTFLLWRRLKFWQILFSGLIGILLIFVSKNRSEPIVWIYNGGFLALYLGILIYSIHIKPIPREISWSEQKEYVHSIQSRKQLSAYLLFGVMVIELTANLVNFGLWFPGTSIKNYPSGKKDTKKVIAYMHQLEKDNLFFRAETTHSQTLNDGAINGYNGVSTFTSSANVKTTEFMKALGYGAKNTYNRYCFEEASPVSNLFLGLKYMIERDGKVEANPYFDDIYQSGSVHLLENNAYLPLGFLANNELTQVNFTSNQNRFLFQNILFTAATGVTTNVWDTVAYNQLHISGENVTINSQSNNGRCNYTTDSEAAGTVTYRYMADREGLLCIDVDLSKRNAFKVLLNGTELYSETHSLPQMHSVSNVIAGDVVEIQFTCKQDETGDLDVIAAIMSEDTFRKGYEVLNDATLDLTNFDNTLVEGTIECNRDGLLYTSIPQNGNWSVLVDGEPVEIQLIGNAMIGISLTKGQHNITFQYKNPAVKYGVLVSCCSLITLLAIIIPMYCKRRYTGKYNK